MRLITAILIVFTWTISHGQSSTIKFEDFVLEISNFAPFDTESLDRVFEGDMYFTGDLGETLGASTLTIRNSELEGVEVFQRFETSVTIMNEGPHCDLVNWKHYTSDWKKLESTGILTFRANTYSNSELTKFPDVDMNELMDAASKQCGEEWGKLILKAETPKDYPCDVGVSKYFIKVKATNKTTRKRIERTITINIPMGC